LGRYLACGNFSAGINILYGKYFPKKMQSIAKSFKNAFFELKINQLFIFY